MEGATANLPVEEFATPTNVHPYTTTYHTYTYTPSTTTDTTTTSR